ncbi:MAG: PEF-CTERM sorting domain-containing protein [Methanosarcinaceae archaeon]|nr:PEF-CTERM sorting domain-containing protein [Methanosarcinaceae archaeon]
MGEGFEAIPEFPTIAIPMIAILGLAFMFQRRKD